MTYHGYTLPSKFTSEFVQEVKFTDNRCKTRASSSSERERDYLCSCSFKIPEWWWRPSSGAWKGVPYEQPYHEDQIEQQWQRRQACCNFSAHNASDSMSVTWEKLPLCAGLGTLSLHFPLQGLKILNKKSEFIVFSPKHVVPTIKIQVFEKGKV